MENASKALEMAGAMLIFIMAFSIIMIAFTQVRSTSDAVLSYKDRETEYEEDDAYFYKVGNGTRSVGLETIIPSIYRAYLENYKIVFEFPDGYYLYKVITTSDSTGDNHKRSSLDLEQKITADIRNVSLANDEQKKRFIKGILYRDFSGDDNSEDSYKKFFGVNLPLNSLYDELSSLINQKGYNIIEHLGVYYQSDDVDVPNVNKVKKRIITYTFQTKT